VYRREKRRWASLFVAESLSFSPLSGSPSAVERGPSSVCLIDVLVLGGKERTYHVWKCLWPKDGGAVEAQ
jgi:hypothetical protein